MKNLWVNMQFFVQSSSYQDSDVSILLQASQMTCVKPYNVVIIHLYTLGAYLIMCVCDGHVIISKELGNALFKSVQDVDWYIQSTIPINMNNTLKIISISCTVILVGYENRQTKNLARYTDDYILDSQDNLFK